MSAYMPSRYRSFLRTNLISNSLHFWKIYHKQQHAHYLCIHDASDYLVTGEWQWGEYLPWNKHGCSLVHMHRCLELVSKSMNTLLHAHETEYGHSTPPVHIQMNLKLTPNPEFLIIPNTHKPYYVRVGVPFNDSILWNTDYTQHTSTDSLYYTCVLVPETVISRVNKFLQKLQKYRHYQYFYLAS